MEVNQHGGKRKGAGRHPRPTGKGQRVNVYLPGDLVTWWTSQTGNRSEWVAEAIRNEIIRENEMSKEQKARKRIEKMGFTQAEQDFIFADWPNWGEHIDWLLTATKKEITSWIKSAKVEIGKEYDAF